MASDRHDNPNPYVSPASPPRGQDPRDWEPLVPGEVLRIQGVLSPKDLFAANKLRGKDKPADGFSAAALFSFLFLATLAAAIGVHFALIILALVFLAPALGFGYAALRSARRIDRYWRDQQGVFQAQQIEITEQGIRQQTMEISAAYRWNVFATHTASKRVVILDFDPPERPWHYSTFGCLVIPREFFLCDADWDRFVRLVGAKLPKKYREPRRHEPFDPPGAPEPEVAAASEPDLPAGEAGSRGEIIRIGGTISPKDLFAANKLAHQEKPSDAITAVVILSLVFMGICVVCLVTQQLGWLCPAAAFLALSLALGHAAFRSARRVDRYWRHQRGIFRPQRGEITEQGIRQRTEDRAAAYRWDAFSEYAASERVAILHFDPRDGWFMHSMRGYLVIAREIFPSDADWDRFLRLAQKKLPKR